LLKGIVKHFKKKTSPTQSTIQPTIIPRAEHSISRKDINRNALKVLYRLHDAGFGAYLVGGCVRDLLLNRRPKDFDIATNAHPEEIRKLFKNCRLIGKRFRLAHIVFGREIIEVATFRTHHKNAEHETHAKTHQGMIVRDNVYGTIEDDAARRDFTINGLYYNIADFSIIDYVNGMQDIETRTIRMIGDPDARYHEDPVRILRAIRFMGKLGLDISPETEKPILELRTLLQKVSPARLFLEVSKLFHEGAMLPTFQLLRKYQLLSELFPMTEACLNSPEAVTLLEEGLRSTDDRIKDHKTVSPAFIFSVFLWPTTKQYVTKLEGSKLPPYVIHEKAIHEASGDLTERLAIPRALVAILREICLLQFRFTQRFGTRPYRLLGHPRFRAAYDLLLLRGQAGEPVKELGEWWTIFYDAEDSEREAMLKNLEKANPASKKKKRKKKKVKTIKEEDINTQIKSEE
jgi:poly(A) polymerase